MNQQMTKPYSKEAFLDDPRRLSYSIAVTSTPGAGSSIFLKRMRLRFPDFRCISGGDIMRRRAEEFGFSTIGEFADYNRKHPEDGHDKWCDDRLREFGKQNFCICESRLAHANMRWAFKVLLFCSTFESARRIFSDEERYAREFHGKTFEEIKTAIELRDLNDRTRYEKLYPGSVWSPSDFDFVLDTQKYSPKQIENLVLNAHFHWWDCLKEYDRIESVTMCTPW